LKLGDLVRYRGWRNQGQDPIAIVVAVRFIDSDFHKRIRVMWIGEKIPVQASVISVNNSRISTWVHPKNFILVSNCDNISVQE